MGSQRISLMAELVLILGSNPSDTVNITPWQQTQLHNPRICGKPLRSVLSSDHDAETGMEKSKGLFFLVHKFSIFQPPLGLDTVSSQLRNGLSPWGTCL